jgi:hypothetical protein
VSRQNVFWIEIQKDIPRDELGVPRNLKLEGLELPINRDKRGYHHFLDLLAVRSLEFVREEQYLSQMPHSKCVSIVTEGTFFIEDQVKVCLHKCGYTSIPVRAAKLAWNGEPGLLQTPIESFT